MPNATFALLATGFDLTIADNFVERLSPLLRVEHNDTFASSFPPTQRVLIRRNILVDSGLVISNAGEATSGNIARVVAAENLVIDTKTHGEHGINVAGTGREKFDVSLLGNIVAGAAGAGIRCGALVAGLVSGNVVFNNNGLQFPGNPGGIRLDNSRNVDVIGNYSYEYRGTPQQPAVIPLLDSNACSVSKNVTKGNVNSSIIELGSANNNRIGFNVCWEGAPSVSGADTDSNFNITG